MASERRPYVKIPDSVGDEPWDDATLADMIRLQIHLNTRWARLRLPAAEAGHAFLGAQAMMKITRTTNVTRARNRLLALPDRTAGVSLAVAQASQGRDKGVIVDWPKFVIEQGYKDRESPQLTPNLPPNDPLPQPQPHMHEKKKKEREPQSQKNRRSESPTLAPETLPEEAMAKLLAWAATAGFSPAACAHAWERTYEWSHRRRQKRSRWWVCCKEYMIDGWALRGFDDTPKQPKTFNEIEEAANARWLADYSESHGTADSGTGSSLLEPGNLVAKGRNGGSD